MPVLLAAVGERGDFLTAHHEDFKTAGGKFVQGVINANSDLKELFGKYVGAQIVADQLCDGTALSSWTHAKQIVGGWIWTDFHDGIQEYFEKFVCEGVCRLG
jgi:hypothetical protein